MTTLAIAPSTLWVPPPASLSLSSPDVHLWCAALDRAGEDILQLYQTLSDDERDRANRFHFETDQTRFIVARGLLRNILSRYLNLDAKHFNFATRATESLL
ncbi:MAG: hypothetical protein HC899_11795 [Leptolyngbyaceae cyanobacterium SM1_4_3]|nr:hypothetical protein [Leptolyngbyaceae cyanobacterium SM1_4_3]